MNISKREAAKRQRSFSEYRLQWRRGVEQVFDLKPAPELPEPGVYDLADEELG